jgi:NadR type nicotinamide-nucleotide adenylyltransferase
MITVAIVGPESTGKTEISKALAQHFKTKWVPEYARAFLSDLGRPYVEDDLVDIAKGQLDRQEQVKNESKDLVFFDTDLLVMKIWSEFKYGRVNPYIETQWELNMSDFYILTYFDIPYEEDPLRENPEQRPALFDIYKAALKQAGASYVVVKGDRAKRLQQAVSAINNIL